MEEHIKDAVDFVVPIVEAVGVFVIAVGVVVTLVTWVLSELRVRPARYERIRLQLGRYLALGLEFLLAADIMATAVSPTWEEIGQLAAIAAIRTALNFFLTQELDRERAREPEQAPPKPRTGVSDR